MNFNLKRQAKLGPEYYCTGVIINPWLVMTSAACGHEFMQDYKKKESIATAQVITSDRE